MAQDRPRDETAIDVGWWPLLQAAGSQWLRHNDARLADRSRGRPPWPAQTNFSSLDATKFEVRALAC
jgi:hypothetical protein